MVSFCFRFTVAGSVPKELCRITVDGQGPVISYMPDEVQFNEITLLHTTINEFTLINDSPVPATIQITEVLIVFYTLLL